MPASDTRQLQLQISASAELLIRNLKTADNAVASFQRDTNSRLSSIDAKFSALGALKGKLANLDRSVGLGDIADVATGVTLVALAKRGLDYASSLGEVSQQLGVTTRDLQVYTYAASQAGIEQETMEKGLAKLTLTIGKAQLGAEGPAKAFDALGISIESLKGKSAGDVIPRIADGLAKIKDPAQRAALEVELFGKAGQKLDTLLSGGSKGINELSNAAERLGLVLSDEQIANADETADKLSAVKQVLEANVAKVVADNANSILSLANAFGTLSGEVIRFLNSNPQAALGLVGALVGGRVGGLPGAAAGAVAGYIGGERIRERQADSNTDITFRRRELSKALREAAARTRAEAGLTPSDEIAGVGSLFSLRRNSTNRAGGTAKTAIAEVDRQRKLLATALGRPKPAAPGVTPVPTGEPPKIFAPSGPKSSGSSGGGKSAEQLAREADSAARKDRADQRRASDTLRRAELDEAASRADRTGDPDERLKIEQDRVDLARQGRDADLELSALDNRYIAANLDRLKKINGETAEIDKQILTQKRAQEIDQDAANRVRAGQDDQIALLDIQSRLAIVAKDRHEIERRILALKQQEEREALQRVVDDKNNRYTPADRTLARDQLDRLPERQAAESKALDADQAGPIKAYRDQLLAATGDMNTALEGVAVNGLQTLEDGLLGVINGTESVGSAFKRMAASIIADLARIAIEKAIVNAIGSSFLGFAEGGVVPAFAGGGVISGPGNGTSDSILARVSAGEGILTADALQHYGHGIVGAINSKRLPAFASGGVVASRLPSVAGSAGGEAGQIQVMVSLTEDLDARIDNRALGVSVQVMREGAPTIVRAATQNTMSELRRPSI